MCYKWYHDCFRSRGMLSVTEAVRWTDWYGDGCQHHFHCYKCSFTISCGVVSLLKRTSCLGLSFVEEHSCHEPKFSLWSWNVSAIHCLFFLLGFVLSLLIDLNLLSNKQTWVIWSCLRLRWSSMALNFWKSKILPEGYFYMANGVLHQEAQNRSWVGVIQIMWKKCIMRGLKTLKVYIR